MRSDTIADREATLASAAPPICPLLTGPFPIILSLFLNSLSLHLSFIRGNPMIFLGCHPRTHIKDHRLIEASGARVWLCVLFFSFFFFVNKICCVLALSLISYNSNDQPVFCPDSFLCFMLLTGHGCSTQPKLTFFLF